VGQLREGPWGVLPLCTCRLHRCRQAAVHRTPRGRDGNLELSRRRGTDALHDDVSFRPSGGGGQSRKEALGRGRCSSGGEGTRQGHESRGQADESRHQVEGEDQAEADAVADESRRQGKAGESRRQDEDQDEDQDEGEDQADGRGKVKGDEDDREARRRDAAEEDRLQDGPEGALTARVTDGMPFLRFSRDKRGYESTYLCHTYRSGGEPRLRVLYWFRSPPGVKVGRLALDPEAIRAIEESHPGLRFDWDTILKVKPPPPPPDLEGDGRMRRRRGRAAAVTPPARPVRAPRGRQVENPKPVTAEPTVSATDAPASAADWEAGPDATPGLWGVVDPDGEPRGQDEDEAESEVPARHVALGLTDEQGLARLRARHVELQARISEQVQDPDKLERLRGEAARLDPDAWQTVAEARERLASLDEATAAIRSAIGRRRRRPTRRRPKARWPNRTRLLTVVGTRRASERSSWVAPTMLGWSTSYT
jgi:hypothetical protein